MIAVGKVNRGHQRGNIHVIESQGSPVTYFNRPPNIVQEFTYGMTVWVSTSAD